MQKETRVTGEVNVRKDVKRDIEQVSDTVRREDVHVEGSDSERVHVEGLSDAQRHRYGMMSAEEQRRYAGMNATDREAFEREYDDRGNMVDQQQRERLGTDPGR